jgi:hypothetical protein
MCRAASSADARELSSVVEVIREIVVQQFQLVVSYGDTTEEFGRGYKCFRDTRLTKLARDQIKKSVGYV